MAHAEDPRTLRLGLDVGSTTVKAVALDPGDNSVLFTRYQRHNAHQAATVRQILEEAAGGFPMRGFGSGSAAPAAGPSPEPWGPATSRRWWPTPPPSGHCTPRSAPLWSWAARTPR